MKHKTPLKATASLLVLAALMAACGGGGGGTGAPIDPPVSTDPPPGSPPPSSPPPSPPPPPPSPPPPPPPAPAAQFREQPQAQSVAVGSTAVFSVTLENPAEGSLQWLRNGLPLPGATTRQLTLPGVACADSADAYSVELRGSGFKVRSEAGALTVTGCRYTLVAGDRQLLPGTLDGLGERATFGNLRGLAFDSQGNLLVADSTLVRRVAPDGRVSTVPASQTLARHGFNTSVAVDAQGQLLVAENTPSLIRKYSPQGDASVLAGSEDADDGFARDGIGSEARLAWPGSIALDPSGQLLVLSLGSLNWDNPNPSRFGGGLLRKVSPAGEVTTVADLGALVRAAEGEAAATRFRNGFMDVTDAQGLFTSTSAIAVDPTGRIFIADRGNHVVRELRADGSLRTVAGASGQPGTADGAASAARFRAPGSMAFDTSGNLLVADTGNYTIRKIAPDGQVSTVIGTPGVAGNAGGAALAAQLGVVQGMAFDRTGRLHLSMRMSPAVQAYGHANVRVLEPDGELRVLAGSNPPLGDGAGAAARVTNGALAIDAQGRLYLGETMNHQLRRITPDGRVSSIAGSAGQLGFTDAPGAAARFYYPHGVAVDGQGTVYVSDARSIRRIAADGSMRKVLDAFLTADSNPDGLAVDAAGNLYVADRLRNAILKFTPSGEQSVLAGGNGQGSADGAGAQARFDQPSGLAIDAAGNLYTAEVGSRKVRRITPAGVVSTVATLYTDNFAASLPVGGYETLAVALDAAGNLYVSDPLRSRIHRVAPQGTATVVAGRPPLGAGEDGPRIADLDLPQGLVIGRDGALYVSVRFGLVRLVLP